MEKNTVLYQCENCGKEVFVNFGSGRFCSKSCQCSYSAQHLEHVKLSNATKQKISDSLKNTLKLKGKPKIICKICGKPISKCGIKAHIASHENKKHNISKRYHLTHEGLICIYCGKQWKSKNSLVSHEIRCKDNPDHIMPSKGFKGGIPWNKGLTKETDVRIKKYSEAAKGKSNNPNQGRASTPEKEAERRRKISEGMKKSSNGGGLRPGSGRGHKGWYRGYFCDSTYELAYIIYNLDHNIPFSRCPRDIYYLYEYKGKTYKYYPDFILSDNSLVEVKGYHSEVVDLKINSVYDRPIKILYEKDLKYAFDYIKETYKVEKLEDLYE